MTKTKTKTYETPSMHSFKPDEQKGFICFGVSWFYDEATADAFAASVIERGRAYNGGFMHGVPCGREPSRDKDGPNGRLYAVTD